MAQKLEKISKLQLYSSAETNSWYILEQFGKAALCSAAFLFFIYLLQRYLYKRFKHHITPMRYLKLFIPAFAVILIINSCVQTPDPDTPKRISYAFNVANVGDTLVVDEDTVSVNQIKILADKFRLQLPDDAQLESQVDAIIMGYNEQNNDEDELVLGVNIGFEDFSRFLGFNLFIAPPKSDDNIQDNDFFGSENNYSVIMRGAFNGSNFTYRSAPNFEKVFSFDNGIELDDEKSTLALRVLLDVEEIFIDEANNKIYNPRNEKAAIDSLIERNIDIDAFATERLF